MQHVAECQKFCRLSAVAKVARDRVRLAKDNCNCKSRGSFAYGGVKVVMCAGPPPAPSRKRALDEEEDDLNDEVKRRLAALKGGGLD